MMTDLTALRRGSMPLDLVKATIYLTGTFAYLAIPWHHAVLAALSLVLQASLGTCILDRLLNRSNWSFLFLLGPGTVVGGAFCLAIFQLAGRGGMGLLCSSLVGLWGAIVLVRRYHRVTAQPEQAAIWFHLVGASLFAVSSEFEWLLVSGLAMFLAGIATQYLGDRDARLRVLTYILLGGVLFLALQLRRDWWWVITDDYKFFEVVAHHLTIAGPLEPWGAVSFLKYHWLSYGWSGLLSKASGTPETLVTLSRIMPIVYATALSSSLLLISCLLRRKTTTTFRVAISVWALLSISRLDWSGTSTAGAYAVVAASASTVILAIDLRLRKGSRLALYLVLAVILGLTKLPSVLVLPPLIIATEILIATRRAQKNNNLVSSTVLILSVASLLVGLLAMSRVTSAFWIEIPNRNLGELGQRGILFTIVGVTTRSTWFVLTLLTVWVLFSRAQWTQVTELHRFLLSLTFVAPIGFVLDIIVSGNANTHEYFSGPYYFVSGLAILTLGTNTNFQAQLPVVSTSSLWVCGGGVFLAWRSLMMEVSLPPWLDNSLFRQTLSDYRIIIGAFLLAILGPLRRLRSHARFTLLMFIVCLSLPNIGAITSRLADETREAPPNRNNFTRELGSEDSETVGIWLRENTPIEDVIATNALLRTPTSQTYGSDYSLAMWSQRKFLVLGPAFANATETAAEPIDWSMRFGLSPNNRDATLLYENGVRWFVIDLDVTSHRDWSHFGEVLFKNATFWVLKLYSKT